MLYNISLINDENYTNTIITLIGMSEKVGDGKVPR